ncbi:hypothetical protein [Streptococcus dysgalactiae]|uniref:Uncharacterized protein n=1 Tax=Streptococcus dysgalactiae subsp. equisimilis TaxID=119602 RepID=A0A9X8XG63_STREQ|nr:hypothetical protein [Streptococcus dysgalactiae]SQF67465.1 Uncharacterised protein [Streptococcus dysgalactiae subsp. equisimilis]VEF05973.1 Uncharacterised protein [Streptococcus dysgalactiae subsp. equisimilis]
MVSVKPVTTIEEYFFLDGFLVVRKEAKESKERKAGSRSGS